VHALLDLMDAARAEGGAFPAVHAGVAHGPVLQRWGDYYGGPVNLAARLAERAVAGVVLADPQARERAADARLEWLPIGVKDLKGVSRPVPAFSVRRAGEAGAGA
jgi:class 3 adenylate cyclase